MFLSRDIRAGELVELTNNKRGNVYDFRRNSVYWLNRDIKLVGTFIALSRYNNIEKECYRFSVMKDHRAQVIAVVIVFGVVLANPSFDSRYMNTMGAPGALEGYRKVWVPGLYCTADDAESADLGLLR